MTETVETSRELAEATDGLIELRGERREMLERHALEVADIDREIADLTGRQAHLIAGTTEEELSRARDLIEVTWHQPRLGPHDEFDEQVVQEAVEDIAAGCPTLRSEYFCRRVYEGNLHRETYEYNFGPRHGNAVFRIGLTKGAREFLRRWGRVPLGADGEVGHAAIRYLLNLREAGRP